MLSPELIKRFKTQAEIEMNAASQAFALRQWTKNAGWGGSHKWFGREQADALRRVNGIGKFLLTYCQVDFSIPAASECPAVAMDLPDAFAKWRDCLLMAQEGWKSIASAADEGKSKDAEEFTDRYLDSNIREIKKLNRFMNVLEASRGNVAALMIFDEARE